MSAWLWAVIVVFVVGFCATFILTAREKAKGDNLWKLADPMWAALGASLIWPFALMTHLAIFDLERSRRNRVSRGERKALERKRIAEIELQTAKTLAERERTLGL